MVRHQSSLSLPPDDDFTVPDLEEESGQTAIAENLDRLTTSHKHLTSDDMRFPDETLPSARASEMEGVCGDGIVSIALG
jgi:hypothetical protein